MKTSNDSPARKIERSFLNASTAAKAKSTPPSHLQGVKPCASPGGRAISTSQALRNEKALFPVKLHALLSVKKHADIVSWSENGKFFTVHDRQRFVKEVLPKYFEASKLTSFQRQLNLYGFSRVFLKGRGNSPKGISYYRENFESDQINIPGNILRTRIKGTGKRGKSSAPSLESLLKLPAGSAANGSVSGAPSLGKKSCATAANQNRSHVPKDEVGQSGVGSLELEPLPLEQGHAPISSLYDSDDLFHDLVDRLALGVVEEVIDTSHYSAVEPQGDPICDPLIELGSEADEHLSLPN